MGKLGKKKATYDSRSFGLPNQETRSCLKLEGGGRRDDVCKERYLLYQSSVERSQESKLKRNELS